VAVPVIQAVASEVLKSLKHFKEAKWTKKLPKDC
jgi:hypothetical protein